MVWFLVRASVRAVSRLPRYFVDGDGLLDSFANVAIALRRWPESVAFQRFCGRLPNYMNPQIYAEKMQWRKLFDRNPELVVFSDKLATRELVRERAPGIRLPKLLWQGEDPDSIPFDTLSPPYVVKANNRSGAIILVPTSADMDEDRIRETCRGWMEAAPHSARAYEWAYGQVETRLLVEELLLRPGTELPPPDLKVLVFHDNATHVLYRDSYRDEFAVFTADWIRYDLDRWKRWLVAERIHYNADVPRPRNLDQMIEAAKQIAAGIDHLRVDMYDVDGTVFFGEATVYHASGNQLWIRHEAVSDPDPPDDLDGEMGDLWQLPPISKGAMLRRGLLG